MKGVTLRLAWRNLWRQPRRTWLTTGAMVFSNVLLVFLISMQFGMYRLMYDNSLSLFSGHLQVQARGYVDEPRMRLTVPDVAALAEDLRGSLDGARVAARGFAFALASSEERSYGVQVVGVQPEHEPGVSTLPDFVQEGRYLRSDASGEAIVGATLARNLKVGIGDELTLLGSGPDGSFAAGIVIVVGVFETGTPEMDRSFVQIPLVDFQEIFSMGNAGHAVAIMTDDLFGLARPRAIAETQIAGNADLLVHDWTRLVPGLRQSVKTDMGSALFMYAVLVVLVAFSVLNTQLMSVLDRTREFGIVMALGLRPSRLGGLVLLETALMAALGLVIGVGLGALVVTWFGTFGFTYPGLDEMAARFHLPGRIYPSASLASLLIGPSAVFLACLLAAVYPASRLLRMQPVTAMRAA